MKATAKVSFILAVEVDCECCSGSTGVLVGPEELQVTLIYLRSRARVMRRRDVHVR